MSPASAEVVVRVAGGSLGRSVGVAPSGWVRRGDCGSQRLRASGQQAEW